MNSEPIGTLMGSVRAGLSCACPRCGEGRLFRGFLTLQSRCEVCGLDYRFADSGDGPCRVHHFPRRLHCGRRRIGDRSGVAATLMGPCGVVAAADFNPYARTIAADERTDDRAAVPSQGCRGTFRGWRRREWRLSPRSRVTIVARPAGPGGAAASPATPSQDRRPYLDRAIGLHQRRLRERPRQQRPCDHEHDQHDRTDELA